MFHYTEFMEEGLMDEAEESLRGLISEYGALQDTEPPVRAAPRFQPL